MQSANIKTSIVPFVKAALLADNLADKRMDDGIKWQSPLRPLDNRKGVHILLDDTPCMDKQIKMLIYDMKPE